MSRDPSPLSLADLRARHLDGGRLAPPRLLAALRADPRRGAGALVNLLERRRAEVRAETRRLGRLLAHERALWATGVERVAGVDEAGVGPLAGPVVAAAVVFRPGTAIRGVDDSKKLDAARRGELAAEIRAAAAGWAVGVAEVAEIDALNVYQAGLLAMRRAVEGLPDPPEQLLVDAREVPGLDLPQASLIGGDARCFSIAAASILAKTHRDALMDALDADYPAYGFAKHRGYATAEHRAALRREGPCPAHRAWAALEEFQGRCSEAFYDLQARLATAATAADLRRFDGELDDHLDLPDPERKKLRLLLARRRRTAGLPPPRRGRRRTGGRGQERLFED